jgi:hypothetical protein
LFLSESIAWESDRDAGSTNYLAAKLDAECPYQIVLPRRQLMDDSTIMDFLLSYVGKFDLYVEDHCPAFLKVDLSRREHDSKPVCTRRLQVHE